MSLRDVVREFAHLPLAMLDAPILDARIDRDPDKLDELSGDIAVRGVILPLAVVRTGERYELIDGFRRFLASIRAGLVVVPCMIYPDKTAALEGVKYAANLFREEMSPAEEAVFFHQLLTHECAGDIEKLCALVNKKLPYVDNRLALLSGDAEVFEAVRANKITLGVAQELNDLPAEDYRRYYLNHAIRDGASIATVRGWVMQWRAMYREDQPAAPAAPAPGPHVASPALDIHYCYVCRQSNPQFIPEQISVHTHCRLATLDPMIDAFHGGNTNT